LFRALFDAGVTVYAVFGVDDLCFSMGVVDLVDSEFLIELAQQISNKGGRLTVLTPSKPWRDIKNLEEAYLMYMSFQKILRGLSKLGARIVHRPLTEQTLTRITTPGQMMRILGDVIARNRPVRLVLDSLSALKRQYDPVSFTDAIRMLGNLCKINDVTAVFLSLEDLLSGEKVGFSTIADTLIALSFEKRRNDIRRILAILKMRGSPHDRRIKVLDFRRGRVVLRDAGKS